MGQYRIVVGVDGSPPSENALRWALWQAELTRGAVTAVRGWDYPELYEHPLPGPDEIVRRTAAALDETVAKVAADADSGLVERRVGYGHPAESLLDTAEELDADLLVVGSRGHGGFAGALLGSISQYCVRHARCPVVVVRQGAS